jgi:hypothetical protein
MDQQLSNFQHFSLQQELPTLESPQVETAFERVGQIFNA